MKLLNAFVAFAALSPVLSHAYDTPDPCAPVVIACEAAGFSQAKDAPAGKKVWQDAPRRCSKARRSLPSSWTPRPALIAKYKITKDAFQADWMSKNKP